MLTLITLKPNLFNSASTLMLICSKNFSLSWLISSIDNVAITSLNCPKIISLAIEIIVCLFEFKSLSAAFCIILGLVEMANVNVEGTATLIFPLESAPLRSISVVMGSNDNIE